MKTKFFSILIPCLLIFLAIGFYFKWNFILLMVLLVCAIFCSFWKSFIDTRFLIKTLIASCEEKIRKVYRRNIRKFVAFYERKIYRWKLNEADDNQISLLSPIDDFDRHKEYIIRLKNAINKSNVFNIALTGAYGAGKSSILKTFKAYYTEYNYVNVSLASFVEVNYTESDHSEKDKECDDFEEQLEYSILQQLFYHVKARNIPESRFGRIERSSKKERILYTLAFFLITVACLFLFNNSILSKYFFIPDNFLNSTFVFAISAGIFVLGLLIVIFKLILCIKKISIKSLKLDKATLELEEKKNVSIMNRYLDEIIYLFQENKYDVVIFEDIDRFENTHIFTKLRELNLILNQSEEIGRRIVFLYALKDDIFSNAEERTKFFDYIVPVIPFVNVSNSGDLFRRKIAKLNIPEAEVHSSFITDISAFVNDMRVLTNVVNEFDLYRNLLDPKLNKEKLLAMILYKNLYPTDFSLLHQNKGVVYETFRSANTLRHEIEKDDMNRRKEIDGQIQAINEEFIQSIEELQAVIIGKFMRLCPGNDWHFYYNESYINIHDMYSDEFIHLILSGKIGFKNRSYYHPQYFKPNEVERALAHIAAASGENLKDS